MLRLAELHLCTGCTACAAVCPNDCIAMVCDNDGFLRPEVDEGRCVGCGLCESVCPVRNPCSPGHMPEAYAVKSRDQASRLASTSGGVFAELAQLILAQGGAVYGAAYDAQFRVAHICAETEAELARLRGAKYAQSDLGGSFRDVRRRLEEGQPVLFSGTPCQVLGLKAFLGRDYENLLLVDLVCHSVPSPLAWKRYLEYISGEKQLAAVNLRCKDTGWSRYRYSNRFDFSDGSSRSDRSAESLYMKLFGGGYISRPSCEHCPAKGYARVSDLTLGDFWGIWNLDPGFDDDRGVSLVLAQTRKGRSFLERISGNCLCRAVALADASGENPALIHAARAAGDRQPVMELIRTGRVGESEAWFAERRLTPIQRCLQRLRRLLKQD